MGNVRGYQGNNARPNSGGQSAGQRRVSNNGPLPKPPAVAPKDKKANPLLPAPAATKKDSGSRTAESTVNSTVNSTGGSNKNAKSKEMTQSSAGSTISTMEGDSKDAPPKSSKRRNRKNKGTDVSCTSVHRDIFRVLCCFFIHTMYVLTMVFLTCDCTILLT